METRPVNVGSWEDEWGRRLRITLANKERLLVLQAKSDSLDGSRWKRHEPSGRPRRVVVVEYYKTGDTTHHGWAKPRER